MELLPFVMPPFLRIQWVSKEIKMKYEPMLQLAKNFYATLEKDSVRYGLRHCTTDSITAEEMDIKQQQYIKDGLYFLPLQKVGMYSGFSNYHPAVEEGKPWHYYGVVADSVEHAEQFAHATEIGDHKTIGRLLGFPDCCIDMFNNDWMQGYVDPIWQQAINTDENHVRLKESNLIRLKDLPWQSNAMLRVLGVGPIFHIKDRFDCLHTHENAMKWVELGEKLEVEGLKEMEMFLRMPMEWDVLKGIAYIKTPLFKAAINSVTSTERFIVQVEGTYYPDGVPRGGTYPWTEQFVTVARNGNKLDYQKGDL